MTYALSLRVNPLATGPTQLYVMPAKAGIHFGEIVGFPPSQEWHLLRGGRRPRACPEPVEGKQSPVGCGEERANVVEIARTLRVLRPARNDTRRRMS